MGQAKEQRNNFCRNNVGHVEIEQNRVEEAAFSFRNGAYEFRGVEELAFFDNNVKLSNYTGKL